MIHFIEETQEWVISSGDMWLSGVYDSKRAANYAFRFSDQELHDLQFKLNRESPGKCISFEMLQDLRRKKSKK